MTHEEKIARWIPPGAVGVEIGAFKSPIPGLTPFYVDCFSEFAGEPCLFDYWGTACELPFRDNSLDYVATSHVLEHVANPVAAFKEWMRVLRHGGLIYLVVPDRRFTWDHARELTPPEHMFADFQRGTTQSDGTHIADFVDNVDWTTFSPTTPPEEHAEKKRLMRETYAHAVKNALEINIHFHVFEPSNLRALVLAMTTHPATRFDLAIVDEAERFPTSNPNGILMVIRVAKSWRDRWDGWRNRRRTRADRNHAVLPNARRTNERETTKPT